MCGNCCFHGSHVWSLLRIAFYKKKYIHVEFFSQRRMNGIPATAAFVVQILLLIIGLTATMYAKGRFVPQPASVPCPAINVTTHPDFAFTYTRDGFVLLNWHAKYQTTLGSSDARFEQVCPTLQHDTQLLVDGKLAGRTQAHFFSGTHVLDCHGDVVFSWSADNINVFGHSSTYTVRGRDDTVIAHVSTTDGMITIVSAHDRSRVASMQRGPWQGSWKYTVHNTTHPAADAWLLTMFTGQQLSFRSGKLTSDDCNRVFFALAFISSASIVVGVCFVVCGLYGFVFYSFH